MMDLNDAEPQRSGSLIPDGTFAKVRMVLREGGVDGTEPGDEKLLKASASSDSLMLDAEFTVVDGPHARAKFWGFLVVSGGKKDDKGVSKGWNATKSLLKGMIDSTLGLDPADMSDAAKQKRRFSKFRDFDGITFYAKIEVEPSADPKYGDKNRLGRAVVPSDKQYAALRSGQDVPPEPSNRRAPTAAAAAAQQPAWAGGGAAQPAASGAPAWAGSTAPAAAAAAAKPAAAAGPSWLNG